MLIILMIAGVVSLIAGSLQHPDDGWIEGEHCAFTRSPDRNYLLPILYTVQDCEVNITHFLNCISIFVPESFEGIRSVLQSMKVDDSHWPI